MAAFGRAAGAFALGLGVGALGTVMHRAVQPWGLVLSLTLVLVAALTSRAWGRWPTFVGFAGGLFLAVQTLTSGGPGGDVLVPGTDAWGWAWVLGAIALCAVVAVLPRRLFVDAPVDAAGAGPATVGPDPAAPTTAGRAPDER